MITRRARHGCEFCNQRQQSLIKLRVHKRRYHLSEGSLCPFCSSIFPDKILSRHVNACQKKIKELDDSSVTPSKDDLALKFLPRLSKLPPEKIQVDWSSLLAHVVDEADVSQLSSSESAANMFEITTEPMDMSVKSVVYQDGYHIIDLGSSDEGRVEFDEVPVRRSLRSKKKPETLQFGKITSHSAKNDDQNLVEENKRNQRKRNRESYSSGEENKVRRSLRSSKQPTKRSRITDKVKASARVVTSDGSSDEERKTVEKLVPVEEQLKEFTIKLSRAPSTSQKIDSDIDENIDDTFSVEDESRWSSKSFYEDDGIDSMSDTGMDPAEETLVTDEQSNKDDEENIPKSGRQQKLKALLKLKEVNRLLSPEENPSDSDSDVLLSMSDTEEEESSEDEVLEEEAVVEEMDSLCSSEGSDAESETSNVDNRFLFLTSLRKALPPEQRSRVSKKGVPPFTSLFVCFVIDPCNSEFAPPFPSADALPTVNMNSDVQLTVASVCDICGIISKKPLQKHKLACHSTADMARCCYCLGLIPTSLYPLHTMVLCNTRPGAYGAIAILKQVCKLCNPPLEVRNPLLLFWHAIKEHSDRINENVNRFMCPECGGTFLDYFIDCHSKLCKYAASINTSLKPVAGYGFSSKEATKVVRKSVDEIQKLKNSTPNVAMTLRERSKEKILPDLSRIRSQFREIRPKISTSTPQLSINERKSSSENIIATTPMGLPMIPWQNGTEVQSMLRQILKSTSNLPATNNSTNNSVSDQLEVVACTDVIPGTSNLPTPVTDKTVTKSKNNTVNGQNLSDRLKAVSDEMKIEKNGICKGFSTLFLYNIFDPLSPPSLSDAEPDDDDENESSMQSDDEKEVSLNINSAPISNENEKNSSLPPDEAVSNTEKSSACLSQEGDCQPVQDADESETKNPTDGSSNDKEEITSNNLDGDENRIVSVDDNSSAKNKMCSSDENHISPPQSDIVENTENTNTSLSAVVETEANTGGDEVEGPNHENVASDEMHEQSCDDSGTCNPTGDDSGTCNPTGDDSTADAGNENTLSEVNQVDQGPSKSDTREGSETIGMESRSVEVDAETGEINMDSCEVEQPVNENPDKSELKECANGNATSDSVGVENNSDRLPSDQNKGNSENDVLSGLAEVSSVNLTDDTSVTAVEHGSTESNQNKNLPVSEMQNKPSDSILSGLLDKSDSEVMIVGQSVEFPPVKKANRRIKSSTKVLCNDKGESKLMRSEDSGDDVVIIDVERRVKPFGEYICEFCAKDTNKLNNLVNHKRRNHRDGMRCPLCLSAIPKLLLYCHRRIFCPNLHGKVNWNLECCMCNDQQKSPFHLLRHALVCHPENITKSREEKADPNEPQRIRCEHCAAPVRPIFLDCHQEICLRKLRYEMKARPNKDAAATEVHELDIPKLPMSLPPNPSPVKPPERSLTEVSKKVVSSSKFSIAGRESAKPNEETEDKVGHEDSDSEMNIDWLVEKMLVEQGNVKMSSDVCKDDSAVDNETLHEQEIVEAEPEAQNIEYYDESDTQPPDLVRNFNGSMAENDSNVEDGAVSEERTMFLPSSTPMYASETTDAPYTEDDLPDVGCIESPIKLTEVPSPIKLPGTFRSPEPCQSPPKTLQSPVKKRVTRQAVRKAIEKERDSERDSSGGINQPIHNACDEINMNIDLDESVLEPTASDEAMLEDISEVLEAVMREENGHGLECQ